MTSDRIAPLSIRIVGILRRLARKFLDFFESLGCSAIVRIPFLFKGELRSPVILCVQYYRCTSDARQNEIDSCLQSNLLLPWIDNVILFCENCQTPSLPLHPKLIIVNISSRLTYNHCFEWTKKNLASDAHIILVNSDITLTNDLIQLIPFVADNDFLALTRYESETDAFPFLMRGKTPRHPCISQDTWMFKNVLTSLFDITSLIEIPLGVPGCESRLQAELFLLGVKISNPCLDVKTIHLHDTNERTYNEISRLYGLYAFPRAMTKAQFMTGRRFNPQIISKSNR